MKNILKIIENRTYSLRLYLNNRFGTDETYLKCMFYHRLGYRLNLNHPETFNEKLQWMKLHDHNPKYTEYADKYKVREHISQVLGEDYLIPLIGVYSTPDEIPYDLLPDQFVLKCNHGAGYNYICKNKNTIDKDEVNRKLNGWLLEDFYLEKREYHYKDIERKIICEKYMEDDSFDTLLDYKFFCINGEVYMIQVDFDRFTDHRRNIYDVDWNLLDVEISFPKDTQRSVPRPVQLDKMIEFAEKLSKEFREVRVDFYLINGKIYFGEMTFFSGAGFSKYNPQSFEAEMGKKLSL